MGQELFFTFTEAIRKKVHIYLGNNSLLDLEKILKSYIGNIDNVFILADEEVVPLYGNRVLANIQSVFPAELLALPSGENNKNLATVENEIEIMFSKGLTKKSCLCALGGGITGNVTGLISSLVYRGIKHFFIPTTLLAQLDSSIGVKQSVNTSAVKNGIGCFKAPEFVLIDPTLLKSLNDRELRSGLAEAVKHAFIQDPEFAEFILNAYINKSFRQEEILQDIILKTVQLKILHLNATKGLWNKESDIKRMTHAGHTIGKVLEIRKVDYLSHGEAIAHGIIVESYISYRLGYLSVKELTYIQSVLSKLDLLFPINKQIPIDDIMKSFFTNKNEVEIPLIPQLGDGTVILKTIPSSVVYDALCWYYTSESNGQFGV